VSKNMNQDIIVQKLVESIQEFDAKGKKNEYTDQIVERIHEAVSSNGTLSLVLFTCSTINSKYLFSKTPWKYVSLNVKGNNIEVDLPRLERVLGELRRIYPKIEVIVLIGNTDPYYIYLQQFRGMSKEEQKLTWCRFKIRWEKYREKLKSWIQQYSMPEIRVVSWYAFEKRIEKERNILFEQQFEQVKNDLASYFSAKDLEWELSQLKIQFGPGKYFTNLECPPENLLKDWIRRKFSEYALQGKWIYACFPNALLIQNEMPSDLRSKMYQPLIREEYHDVLPILYFFGVNNKGYQ
jgi:hypothetical protein